MIYCSSFSLRSNLNNMLSTTTVHGFYDSVSAIYARFLCHISGLRWGAQMFSLQSNRDVTSCVTIVSFRIQNGEDAEIRWINFKYECLRNIFLLVDELHLKLCFLGTNDLGVLLAGDAKCWLSHCDKKIFSTKEKKRKANSQCQSNGVSASDFLYGNQLLLATSFHEMSSRFIKSGDSGGMESKPNIRKVCFLSEE